MARILLVDDSPHAQRMGGQILREEGYDVASVEDGLTAVARLREIDPDVVIADVAVPRRSGYEVCEYIKTHPLHRHTRVILTAGMLQVLDQARAQAAGTDAVLRKPFEASALLESLGPLLVAAAEDRERVLVEATAQQRPPSLISPDLIDTLPIATSGPAEPDPERIRAAVTLALDAAMPALVDEITRKVLLALGK